TASSAHDYAPPSATPIMGVIGHKKGANLTTAPVCSTIWKVELKQKPQKFNLNSIKYTFELRRKNFSFSRNSLVILCVTYLLATIHYVHFIIAPIKIIQQIEDICHQKRMAKFDLK
ncbi:MAG: hypothetical protein SOZ00_03855, partial [Tidjanibacter sp.]|nr:hypothetical protein [Tidjanibacter sp.]